MIDQLILRAAKNTDIYKRLIKDLHSGTQTILFACEDETFAEALIVLLECAVYCKDVCLYCKECKKIINKSKPDLVEINPTGEKVSVEDMRRNLVNDALTGAYEGGKKTYVIRKLSTLNESNQNVLLKTLEEPPEKVVVIMSTSSFEGILPTILSRVSKYTVPPIDQQTLVTLLTGLGVDDAELWAKYSSGNLTMALALSKDETFIADTHKIADILIRLKRSVDVPQYLNNDIFGNMDSALFIIELILSDLLYSASDNAENIKLVNLTNEYDELAKQLNVNALAALMNEITTCRRKLAINCITTNVVDCLLLKVAEEKAKCKQ